MGSFNKIGFISGLPIESGDDTVLVFMLKNKHMENARGGVVYSTDGFKPAFLPVYGSYDDYGKIDGIAKTSATKYIEDFFGSDIDSIIENIDDLSVGRGSDDIKVEKNIELVKDRLTFGLEHKEVFDKMCSSKLIGYTSDYLPEYWLEKIGFVKQTDNNGTERYKETWTHTALPEGYTIHSDGTWGHLMKGLIEDRNFSTYHPSELEEAMLKLNSSYQSQLTDEDKTKCSIDIMLELTKESLKKFEEDIKEESDNKEREWLLKMRSFGENKHKGYDTLKRFADKMALSGRDRYNDDAEDVVKVVDSKLIADFIRFNYSVSHLNAKYAPSNYGSQSQEYGLHYDMLKTYRKIIIDKISNDYDNEALVNRIKCEVKQDDREDTLRLIINEE